MVELAPALFKRVRAASGVTDDDLLVRAERVTTVVGRNEQICSFLLDRSSCLGICWRARFQ